MPVTAGATLDVMIYVIITLYVAPVIAFVVGFWLLTTTLLKPFTTRHLLYHFLAPLAVVCSIKRLANTSACSRLVFVMPKDSPGTSRYDDNLNGHGR